MKRKQVTRTETIRKAFLTPSMENIRDLELYIKEIWKQSGALIYESPIRFGHSDTISYSEKVKGAMIPPKFTEAEEIIKEMLFYFQGMIKWNSPGVMINITPAPLILPIATMSCCSLFNPNLAMDVPSGNLAFAELEVMKMLSDLIGWDYKKSSGVMTFGGKGTILYAIRVGLHSCCMKSRKNGVFGEKIKVFSTEQGHPSHYENCEWLGIGSNNCVLIPVLEDGKADLKILKKELWKAVEEEYKIACIIVNGGSTLYTTVDEIKEVVRIRNELVEHFSLDYSPHIHVDSVIGWAWLMFDDYDFDSNPMNFTKSAISELRHVYELIKSIELVDSFGADFHKTGFTPYACSAFVCKNKEKLYALGDENQAPLDELHFGLYAPFTYTLESSRSGVAALTAWLSLKQLGKEGYQCIIGTLVESGCDLRKHFDEAKYSTCCNKNAHGFVALILLFPKELRIRSNDNLESFSDIELLRIAKYNHRFYLYLLNLQSKNRVDFALDYVSKQTNVRGIKIGVIKLFPMSPFCDLDYLENFYSKFESVLEDYDTSWETLDLKDSPYRPKPFVTR